MFFALLYFVIHLAAWSYAGQKLFAHHCGWIKGTAGLVLGTVALMWSPVVFSFWLGFTPLAQGLGLALSCALAGAIYAYAKPLAVNETLDYGQMQRSILYLGLPLILLMAYLLHTHIILPTANGYDVGQATFGDLQMHMGMVTSLARQEVFPPEYSILPGQRLSYPFLVNLVSSSLYQLGFSLRWAILLPSLLMCTLIVISFILLAFEVSRDRRVTQLATLLFFLNGGLGFIYFFGWHDYTFAQILTEFYKTPTNYNAMNVRWSNVIADMIIPQRTTMAGWSVAFFALWALLRFTRSTGKDKHGWGILAGTLVGLLPMIHTHSFMAIGLISLGWLATDLYQRRAQLGQVIIDWCWYGLPAIILAIGQLMYWTFPQATAGGGFVHFHLNWVNELKIDPYLWFYIKNIGVVYIAWLAGLALLARSNWRERFGPQTGSQTDSQTGSQNGGLLDQNLAWLQLGPLLIYITAEVLIFQPNLYDNNKLFYIWYVFATITASCVIVSLYRYFLRQQKWLLASSIIVLSLSLGCVSGALTIAREWVSSYTAYTPAHVAAAQFIDQNTPKDAMFVTAPNHNNTVAALTGRNIVVGTDTYLFFHGLNTRQRHDDVKAIYSSPGERTALIAQYKVDYIYLSDFERGEYPEFISLLRSYPVIYDANGVQILATSPRAIELARQGLKH
ncbi:hypothetical protein HQ393_16350 [Chitinibacter bivalviorum]|uniref:Uncharacterized protein n=1 Tax=Chitinibacter bivalviorum TaxID=2739434 RepID=A0A7H9BNS2_9NEIS|nr:hypothetical protein [Chitinibacter bivalviorum]QLG89691.1 hypothetical protein HQ393_16350 [Chitinibacter bivalviorum]